MKALEIRQLTKVYAGGHQALNGIDLDVSEGEFFALLGPNGAGKTTTIGIITSLVNKTAGQVSVFGYDIDTQLEAAKSQIGLVPQEFNFNVFEKVMHILITQAGYYGIPAKLANERAEKYLKKLGLWDKRNVQARELSGGMKRRLMIARALVHEPKLLILDEPTAGVDIELRRSMWDFLREINAQGITIILTTHYLEEAEALCRKIAIINQGNIITHEGMDSLLRKLHVETFILYLKNELWELPDLGEFNGYLENKCTLAVDVQRDQSMNDLFAVLAQHNIEVQSMRNKANRLEEMFIKMIAKGEEVDNV